MKKVIFYLILLVFAASLSAQAGSLDLSFGTNGIAQFNPGAYQDVATDIVCLDDGSFLVAGTIFITLQSTYGAIIKVNSDGTQNMNWGTNGILPIQCGVSSLIYKMQILDDGKILVAGTTSVTTPNLEFFLARFLADGTPDLTFGINGYGITSFDDVETDCYAMAVQADGKIILAGKSWTQRFNSMLFARFNANGTLDTTFGANGYTNLDPSVQSDGIRALGILSDGTIIGMGHQYRSTPYYGEFAAMVKLDANGIPVSTFGTNGVLIPPVFADVSMILGMQIVNDDIYATGYMYNASGTQMLGTAKLGTDGNADLSFGTNGITLSQPDTNPSSLGYDILISPDNYIYACGTSGMAGLASPRDFVVLRYAMDGQLDPAFNSTGYNVISIGPSFDDANALVRQPDGKIVLAGFTADLTNTTWNDIALVRILTTDPEPIISVDMSELHFGEIIIGEPATDEFMISNTGTGVLTYEITFPDWISTAVLNGTIAAGGTDTVPITITPTAAMYYSGIIAISNNSVNQPLVEIVVDGTGIEPVTDPPSNLFVDVNTGLFSWDAPTSVGQTGYEVYLNGALQGNTTDLEWQYIGLTIGNSYEAGIKALYGIYYSELATVDFVYEGPSAVDDQVAVLGLLGNYPNPFSTQTTISFNLKNPAYMELSIYNLKGHKVKTLQQGLLGKGDYNYSWNGKDDHGAPLSSGVYFYRMNIAGSQLTRRMILIK
jgi:uncharacterized delta-60 repeat protein